MLSLEKLALANLVLSVEQPGELVKYIMQKYAEESVQNARILLIYSIRLSDIALQQTEIERNKAHLSVETLMNFFGDPPSRTFFAAMVPVCMVVFPAGTSDGGSQKQKEFFAKFVEMLHDPKCFSWDEDKKWADINGYTEYLRKVEEQNG